MRAVFTALCLALLTALPAMAGDEVVARVGTEPITQAEIRAALDQNPDLSSKQVLESLIERRLEFVAPWRGEVWGHRCVA